MGKIIFICLVLYAVVFIILILANMRYWENYYNVYPEARYYDDLAQLKFIKEENEKKQKRKEKSKQFKMKVKEAFNK